MLASSARKAGDVTQGNLGPERPGDRGSRQARAGVCGRPGSAGRSLGSRGLEPRAGRGRAGEGGSRGRYLALRAAGGAEGRRVLAPGPGPSPDPAPEARSLQPPPPPLSTNPGRVTSGAAP